MESSIRQKGLIQLLVVIILVIGLIATLILVVNPNIRKLIFKSSAENPNIVIKDASGNSLPTDGSLPITTNKSVQIQLQPPSP